MNPTRTYYTDGQIESEVWKNETGDFHRLDGPAYRSWHENGQAHWEVWRVNGLYHRLDGPAVRWWCEDGQLQWEAWFINGVEYNTETEFQVAVDLYKANEIAELF